MTQQQAKRVACARIAMQVVNELDSGGYASDQEVKTVEDEKRLRTALQELLVELTKRASGT